MGKTIICAPSILSGNFCEMGKSIELINKSSAEYIHVDVMDGQFVPEITFGQTMVHGIRKLTDKVLDVHLMIENPSAHYKSFVESGADIITFHIETVTHAHREIQILKDLGVKAGIALVPSTPVCLIKELLPFLDLVLIMSVNPGFGGQKIIFETLEKIKELDRIRKEKELNYQISIDGGVNFSTIKSVKESGVDVVITGSAFFNSENPVKFIDEIKLI